MSREAVQVEVAGRRLTVSNLDRVYWPATGFTKGQLLDYYVHVAPTLLPHLADRPLTLRRFPEGVEDGAWYQKTCRGHPEWMRTKRVPSVLEEGKVLDYCLVDDLAGLVWVANLGTIELHPLLATAADVAVPTAVAFDLDPGPPASLLDCCRTALWLRALLDDLGLQAWPKTTGGKGLHVFVPLNSPHGYGETKSFARALAGLLTDRHPGEVTDRMEKTGRRGKVFVDWSQNDATKTTAVAYSLRATRAPAVSTPLTWDEVEAADRSGQADALVFAPEEVLERVDRLGDLFAPVLEVAQRLPAPARQASLEGEPDWEA